MAKRGLDALSTGDLTVKRVKDVDTTSVSNRCLKGVPRKWGVALLEVADPRNFTVYFHGGTWNYVGIAFASASIDILRPSGGSVMPRGLNGFVISAGGSSHALRLDGSGACFPSSKFQILSASPSCPLCLKFSHDSESAPKLSIGYVDQDLVHVKFDQPIPTGSYCPCVVLNGVGSVNVATALACKRRKHQAHDAGSLRKMWDERCFTDAEITCQGHSWKVHRSVLCVNSPVFAAAFGGHMQEAHASNMEIKDATVDDVETMLRFIYTGDINCDGPPESSLLLLAHRYDIKSLIQQCGDQILESVSKDSVAAVARNLRALKEDPEIMPLWRNLLDKIFEDRELFEVVMQEL